MELKGTVSKDTEYFHCYGIHVAFIVSTWKCPTGTVILALAKGFYAAKEDFFSMKFIMVSKSSLINILLSFLLGQIYFSATSYSH